VRTDVRLENHFLWYKIVIVVSSTPEDLTRPAERHNDIQETEKKHPDKDKVDNCLVTHDFTLCGIMSGFHFFILQTQKVLPLG